MNLKKYLIFALVSIFIFSCSIQKKRYSIGYTVQFNKKHFNKKSKKDKIKKSNIDNDEINLSDAIDEQKNENDLLTNQIKVKLKSSNKNVDQIVKKEKVNSFTKTQNTNKRIVLNKKSNNTFKNSETAFSKKHLKDRVRKASTVNKKNKIEKIIKKKSNDDTSIILLYILALFIPFLAVGIVTGWDTGTVIINILLSLLCGLPGIIHAMIIVSRNT